MLDKLRKHFNTSANSKAILKAAHDYIFLVEENKRLCEISRNYHKLLKAVKAAKSADDEIDSLISKFAGTTPTDPESDIKKDGCANGSPE